MSKELVAHQSLVVRAPQDPTPQGLVNVLSGEIIALDAGTDALAGLLDDYRNLDGLVREAKKIVVRELLSRMDKSAKWTMREGQYEIKGDSPGEKHEWNGQALHAALTELVDQGTIDLEAAESALEVKTVYKPKVRGINALMKLGGLVEQALLACRYKLEDPERRVSVKLARPE